MSNIVIDFPDHERIVQQISALEPLARQKLDRVLQQSTALIEGTMKQTTPVKTGLTRASIETRKEGSLTYGVGSYTRGNILRFLDKGTGIYRSGNLILITPTTRRALHFWIKETGDEVFARYCLVKGIIPMEILSSAVHTHLNQIDEMMKEEIKI